jgi:prevent-host-death family protein
MKPVSIAHAKNNLSALLRKVRAGHEITITDRGVPVARIVAAPAGRGVAPRFIELAERGLVTLPDREPTPAWFEGTLPRPRGALANAAVDAVLDERRTGR